MLQFIYSNTTEFTTEFTHSWYGRRNRPLGRNNYINLLRIGHMYNFEKLVNACVLQLAKDLDTHNIFDSLELAERFGAEHLEDAATTFIAGNLKTLINEPKFAEIVKPSSDLLFAILQKKVE
jgi:hypothetical protein